MQAIKGREFWTKHISDQKASGLSQVQYTRNHGLKINQFYSWASRLRSSATLKPRRKRKFVQVVASADKPEVVRTLAAPTVVLSYHDLGRLVAQLMG